MMQNFICIIHLLNVSNDKNRPKLETGQKYPEGICTLTNLNLWEQSHTRETQNDKSYVVIWGFIDCGLLTRSAQILGV